MRNDDFRVKCMLINRGNDKIIVKEYYFVLNMEKIPEPTKSLYYVSDSG